ncbi:MAG: Lin0512 family protein [Pseudomonadota bacterium]
MKRLILEMGTGNDLYGGDYTKAACRAVQDAIHHSSLTMFRALELDPTRMQIELTIAAQEPEKVDCDKVAKKLPYGTVTAKVVHGGLNIDDVEVEGQEPRKSVIVNASLVVRYPL